jgi:hypothetical protein
VSRFSNLTVQTSFSYAPVGIVEKTLSFFSGMVRYEPAAKVMDTEIAQLRMGGRNWLM